jgi:hypothetical protein
MKRLLLIAMGIWLLSACIGVSEEIVLPTVEQVVVPTAVAEVAATEEIVVTEEIVEVATAVNLLTRTPPSNIVPTVTPYIVPQFSNLHFMVADGASAQTQFAPGTEEVFAVWDYVNLSEDDILRREWTKDGELWLEREETWDVNSYGSSGTRSDISVYDFEGAGLEPAVYRLTLYLNGLYQTEAAFEVVLADEPDTLSTSTETQVAWVRENKYLMLDAWDGSQRQLAEANHIVELLWLPDARHLLYVDRRDETDPTAAPWPKHALWLVDTETSEQWQLSTYEENLHRIGFMPEARFIYTIAGSDFADACGMDRSLVFVALDENYQRVAVHDLHEFEGIPTDRGYWVFPELEGNKWVSDHEFDVNITAFCLSEEMGVSEEDRALIGRYRLNLETLTAVQLSSQ